MRERTALLLLALLLALMLCILSPLHTRAEPRIWIVDTDGSASDFQTIQEAVNQATPGDTVYVKGGVYYEHVMVNKSVLLVGENKSTVVVDGSGTGTVFNVTAAHVCLEGFTVRNGESGVVVFASQNCTVVGNFVEGNKGRNILITMSQSCAVIRNHAVGADPGYGINVNASRNVVVEENAASGNRYDGIGLLRSNNSIVRGNTVNDNLLYGLWVQDSHANLFYRNNVFGNGKQAVSNVPSNGWDDGAEGNYWSDCVGVDLDDDGIGDEPHLVDAQTVPPQQDRFPLMRPYVNEVYRRVDTEPPVASFTYSPEVLYVNETVSFDASDTYDSVGKNAIVGYEWDFGDGNMGSGIQVNHTYSAPANFTVILKAVDVAGNQGLASVPITVRLRDEGIKSLFLVALAGVLAAGAIAGLSVLILRRKAKQ